MRRARRTFLACLALSALAGLVLTLWYSRREIATNFVIWKEFESLGPNQQGYREYRHRATGIIFVELPGGAFWMGSTEEECARVVEEVVEKREDGRRAWAEKSFGAETPRHKVVLSPFLMAKYEVTQAQWERIMGGNPSHWRGRDLPVDSVSWEDCRMFCDRSGLALPSEAQWEYACRAGAEGAFGGSGVLAEMGWYDENSGGKSHPVGLKMANDFGLYDMHGNVFELCLDIYNDKFYSSLEACQLDPVCSVDSSVVAWPRGYRHVENVIRGGSFFNPAEECRSASRGMLERWDRGPGLGFRVATRLKR